MFQDFKKFISRGNVIDLAVAVIIGTAFGKIVNSLVNDIIMPPIGFILGHVNFSSLYINLSDKSYATLAQAQEAGAPTINYGNFINLVINFFIVAFCVFLVIRQTEKFTNRFKKPVAPAEPTTKTCPYCITEISLHATRCPNCTSPLSDS